MEWYDYLLPSGRRMGRVLGAKLSLGRALFGLTLLPGLFLANVLLLSYAAPFGGIRIAFPIWLLGLPALLEAYFILRLRKPYLGLMVYPLIGVIYSLGLWQEYNQGRDAADALITNEAAGAQHR
jgi:hypothetical protein